jgi:hypothetical protein
MQRWAILGPTPGREVRPAMVGGMSELKLDLRRAAAVLRYLRGGG